MSDKNLAREAARQLDVMRSGAVAFHGEEELRLRLIAALKEQRPLRIKLGMDPSRRTIWTSCSCIRAVWT
ncbi:MAG: hypothetical protein ACC649_08380, partial [Myxococcota bacterium]